MRREYAVAVFVVRDGAVMVHYHQKLGRWLPPGGHVEPNELPHSAAVRETLEEVGLTIEVVDASTDLYSDVERPRGVPTRLPSPIGTQLEDIPGRPGNSAHQHIDFVFAARLINGSASHPIDVEGGARPAWFTPSEWDALAVSSEVRSWAEAAIRIVGQRRSEAIRPTL